MLVTMTAATCMLVVTVSTRCVLQEAIRRLQVLVTITTATYTLKMAEARPYAIYVYSGCYEALCAHDGDIQTVCPIHAYKSNFNMVYA